jgi:hypothetical protein
MRWKDKGDLELEIAFVFFAWILGCDSFDNKGHRLNGLPVSHQAVFSSAWPVRNSAASRLITVR